ncbi:hypothetical protein PUR61_17895 [Streptomyces sp. BE20]|uniref:hypothetical protein n=1 Tax=Streptomyces sp. BE20 TaxID=3002525 RepID=UPI002E769408|nr:hypothetical protein [Streptomyces sp. BE20]MEE1824048.1 hypothetical protein [Streptomyces sp. BE20]
MNRLLPWPHSPDPAGGPPVRTDYAGALYGSLLAASVIASASVVGDFPRVQAVVLLLVTGLVFWAAHVYANLAGERRVGRRPGWAEIRRVGRHEWPIVEAALLPAAAVAVSPLLGLGLSGAAWLALGIAVAQQVGWACVGAVQAGATRTEVVVEGVINLVLGLVLVAAKAALGH